MATKVTDTKLKTKSYVALHSDDHQMDDVSLEGTLNEIITRAKNHECLQY